MKNSPSSPLIEFLNNQLNTPQNIITGGDCNIHVTSLGSATNNPPLASKRLQNLIEAMESGGCLNDGRPTRIGYPAALQLPKPSAIDITLWNTDDPNSFTPTSWDPGPQLKSDHRTILIGAPFLNLNNATTTSYPNHRKYIINRKIADLATATEALPLRFLHHYNDLQLNTHPLLTSENPTTSHAAINDLTKALTTCIQRAAADVKLIKPAPTSTPNPRLRHYNWTTECTESKKSRDKALRRLRRKKKTTQDPTLLLPLIRDYRDKCQSLNTVIRNTKRQAWRDTCSTLSATTPTGTIWKQFKRLSRSGKTSAATLPTIRHPTRLPATHPHDQASSLADHFQTISSSNNKPTDSNYDQRHFDAVTSNTLPPTKTPPLLDPLINSPISADELQHAFDTLNLKSSPGSDALSYTILANIHPIGHSALQRLFTLSLQSGYVPRKWRVAEVTPLPKIPNPSNTTDYRPISLLPCMGKILEKILHRRLIKHIDINDLNHPSQAGFTRNRSTSLQILRTIQLIHDAWEKGEDLLFLSLDISKAFDSVWRKGLLYKLQHHIGLSGPILQWLSSFLGNRYAYVKVNHATSTTFSLDNSVPQGSILAATLFSIYISDLPDTIPAPNHSALYADDSNLLCPISRTAGPVRDNQLTQIKSTLDDILNWGAKWRLNFHKIQLLIFTPHGSTTCNTDQDSIKLQFHQRIIQPDQTQPVRLLGVWLDCHLSMRHHIDKIIARVQPRLDVLRHISSKSWGADRPTLLHLYTAWIRPVIEYCSTSYATASKKSLLKLDQLQNQALKTITGSSKLASNLALHAILRIQTLGIRRIKSSAKLYIKLQRGDPRDACVSIWNSRPQIPLSNRHNSNAFQPQPFYAHHNPFDILCQAASILDIDTHDTCPEPLLPTTPMTRYLRELSTDPNDIQKKFQSFGPANDRTPAQCLAALQYTKTTSAAYKINLPANGLLIYTDGSANPTFTGGGGIGVVALRPDDTIAWSGNLSTPRITTSFNTELAAIDHALSTALRISTATPTYTSAIVILSDCQSAVNTSRQPLDYNPELRPDYWITRNSISSSKKKLRQAGISVTIDWIPGHTSFPGNDEADRLSKLASIRSNTNINPDLYVPTPASAAYFHIKTRTNHISDITILSSQPKAKTMFKHTDGLLPPDNSDFYIKKKISRSIQSTIDRLTIGDILFNNRLHHIDPSITPYCDHCPCLDSIRHRLLQCDYYKNPRSILLRQIRQIPTLRTTPSLSLQILLGQSKARTQRHRDHITQSLVDFLKATNLVKFYRPAGANNPIPPH